MDYAQQLRQQMQEKENSKRNKEHNNLFEEMKHVTQNGN